QVSRAMQATGQFRQLAGLTAPEAPHRVAIAIIPFAPVCRETAQLIAPGTHIPGFGDQLAGGQQRVLGKHLEKRRLAVKALGLPAEHAGQIETEAVDAHGPRPVAQAVGNQLQYTRMSYIERIATAAVV